MTFASERFIVTVEGKYDVVATFGGSESYYGSSADTYFYANAASTTTSTAPTSPSNLATTSDIMTYMAVGVVAIIIAITIVGLLLLRKKP